MLFRLLMIVPLLLFTGCANTNRMFYTASTTALVLDWAQTRDIASKPGTFKETNKILGAHPSSSQVNAYFAGAVALNTLALLLPDDVQPYWFGGVLTVELGCIYQNYSIGVKLNFP